MDPNGQTLNHPKHAIQNHPRIESNSRRSFGSSAPSLLASRKGPEIFFSLHHRLRADALSDQNKSVRTQRKIDGARAKRVLEQHPAPVPSSFPRFSSTHARSAALVPFRPLSSLSFTLLPLPRWSVSFATMSTRLLFQFSATGL